MTDRLFAAALAIIVAGVLGLGEYIDRYDWPVLRMPLVIGGLAVILLGWIAFRPRPAANTEAAEDDAGAAMQGMNLARDLRGMAQLFVALPMLWLFGFVAGLGLYVLLIVRYHRHGWTTALALAAASAATAYFLFSWLLSVPIPLRPLFLT